MNQFALDNEFEQRVRQLLTDKYGLSGQLTRLPGENLNYLINESSGYRYVLKIASDERSNEIIDMEHRAAEHVALAKVGLKVPQTVLTNDGEIVAELSAQPDFAMRARMLEFVSGTPWCELARHDDSLLSDLGDKLAKLDIALASFEHPAMYRTHQWDLTAVSQHRSKVGLITDGERRRILEWMFHFCTAHSELTLRDVPKAFIHNDANDENLLVEKNQVVGLLDFGDCLYNPVVCGLAITLAYVMLDRDDPLLVGSKVLGAYHKVRALSTNELMSIYPLVCGRLATTVAIAAQRRAINPNHPNWFVTEDRAWELLEHFYEIDPSEACQVLAEGTGEEVRFDTGASPAHLLAQRRQYVGPSLSIAYRQPIKMVRGKAQFLFDHAGRPFLDLVNNICHVGHCHPYAVTAGQQQMAKLNTNTRYLYDGLTEYAQRLCATLPDPLDTCFFVNSGSEANELALRLARTRTGREDLVVVDSAYHGNTGRLVSISPYKFMGPGGTHKVEPGVHLVPIADGYRGRYKGQDSASGQAYGNAVGSKIHEATRPIAAFITESIWSCGGQVVPPQDYLKTAFQHVRAAGGICIVDEVQVGFGRVGKHFWGFQLQGVIPDIVVMGKPMGNGHPLAAVVTTREIAVSFDNGMEFFSSFGGNPVSCAIGMAVLDVIENESLQNHALQTGEYFKKGLGQLAERHEIIGDVRGEGLFLGVELVKDRRALTPATAEASTIINHMKGRGILMSTDGPLDNVLKIKPPMVITETDVDMVLRCLDEVLASVAGMESSN